MICENNTIFNDKCRFPTKKCNKQLNNHIANNEGNPFTAKGYTYNILGSETNKYGVTEVILPQGTHIKIYSTR